MDGLGNGLSYECEGRCLYACLAKAQYGECSINRVRIVRRNVKRAWLENSQKEYLAAVAEQEKANTNVNDYPEKFVVKGWEAPGASTACSTTG